LIAYDLNILFGLVAVAALFLLLDNFAIQVFVLDKIFEAIEPERILHQTNDFDFSTAI
jgi:hypothetical protein